jgi:hypothetical protein
VIQPASARLGVESNGHTRSNGPVPTEHLHKPIASSSMEEAPGAGDAPAVTRTQDFATAFRAAFGRLDRENHSINFVRLLDLRRALPQFDREQFDSGLRQLRLDEEFTLDSHEGRHGPLTDDEREAGVREVGSLLVYASRRT